MAQPVNTFDTYDAKGIKEDLEDIIYDVSPDATPFYSACAKIKAKATYHEWQTDALRSSATNAHLEGDDTVTEARTATSRLGNYTQIFKNAVSIPGTDVAVDKAGRAKEMAYQVMKIAKEQKLDIEKALFANQARSAGSSSTPRYLAGLPAWLTTNTNFQSGNSGADPTGDGTDARTDDGTPTAFSQTKFDAIMQSIWENAGDSNAYSCYLSAFQMNLANAFTGMNNQRSTIGASVGGTNSVVKAMDIYVTSWGNVNFIPSRENRGRDVFILQDDKWAVGVLRGTKNEPLAKTGDSEKRQVVTELTLVSRNEAASGGVFDNTVS